jgi:predicted phosphodiesterase
LAKTRYLILSDIHSNLEALEAVFRAVQRRHYDRVLCMGDLVGYGASPNPVVSRLRKTRNLVVVRGNHDKVCCGLEDGSNFNSAARTAALWTLHHLRPENREFLLKMPQGPREVAPGIWIAHGSFTDEDAYLFSDFDAFQSFEAGPFQVCFFGHTHFPSVFKRVEDGVEFCPLKGDAAELLLDPSARYMINPGSVGQPRDRNPKASFAEYYPDSRRLVLRRVAYDVAGAGAKIKRAGLPENLANRLAVGT